MTRPPLARISHHLTAKARDRCATTSLRSIVVLSGLSSTPPRAIYKKCGLGWGGLWFAGFVAWRWDRSRPGMRRRRPEVDAARRRRAPRCNASNVYLVFVKFSQPTEMGAPKSLYLVCLMLLSQHRMDGYY